MTPENIQNTHESHHYLISPTAKMVAYMRAKSDIPYSAATSKLTESEAATKELLGTDQLDWWMGPLLEQRYKSLSELVQKQALDCGVKNIFEFASGVLPRGILMTEDPEVHYVETDLPDMIAEKRKLIDDLGVDLSERNLSFNALNALDGEEMERQAELMPEGPICFINEGLMPYLTIEEKKKMAEGIAHILRKRGGLWITPDLSNSTRIRDIIQKYPTMQPLLQKISSSTGRDLRTNNFESTEVMQKFFEDLGFSLNEYNQKDFTPNLSMFDQTSEIEDEKKKLILNLLESSKIWVIKLKK